MNPIKFNPSQDFISLTIQNEQIKDKNISERRNSLKDERSQDDRYSYDRSHWRYFSQERLSDQKTHEIGKESLHRFDPYSREEPRDHSRDDRRDDRYSREERRDHSRDDRYSREERRDHSRDDRYSREERRDHSRDERYSREERRDHSRDERYSREERRDHSRDERYSRDERRDDRHSRDERDRGYYRRERSEQSQKVNSSDRSGRSDKQKRTSDQKMHQIARESLETNQSKRKFDSGSEPMHNKKPHKDEVSFVRRENKAPKELVNDIYDKLEEEIKGFNQNIELRNKIEQLQEEIDLRKEIIVLEKKIDLYRTKSEIEKAPTASKLKEEMDLKHYENLHTKKITLNGKCDWFFDKKKNVLKEPWKSRFEKDNIKFYWPDKQPYFLIIGADEGLLGTTAQDLKSGMAGHETTIKIDIANLYVSYIDTFIQKCKKLSPATRITYANNALKIVGKPDAARLFATEFEVYRNGLYDTVINEVKYPMTKCFSYAITHQEMMTFKQIEETHKVKVEGLLGTPWRCGGTVKCGQTLIRLMLGDISTEAVPKICAHKKGATDFHNDTYTLMEKLGEEGKEKVRSDLKNQEAGALFEYGMTRGAPVWHLVYDEKFLEDPKPLIKTIIQKSKERIQKTKEHNAKPKPFLAIPPIGITRFTSEESITKFNLAFKECLEEVAHGLKEIHLVTYDAEICKMFAKDFVKTLNGQDKTTPYPAEKTYHPQPLKDSNKLFFYRDRAVSPKTNNFICWNLENGASSFKFDINGVMVDFNDDKSNFVCKSLSDLKDQKYQQDQDPPHHPNVFEISLIGRDPIKAREAFDKLKEEIKKKNTFNYEIPENILNDILKFAKENEIEYEIVDKEKRIYTFKGFEIEVTELKSKLFNNKN